MPAAAEAGDSSMLISPPSPPPIHSTAAGKLPETASLSLETPVQLKVLTSHSTSQNCLRRSSRCRNRVYMGETEVEFEEIEVELETKSKKQCNSIIRNSPRLISEKSILKKAKIEKIHSTATENPPETDSNDPSLSLETPVQLKVLNSLSSSQNCLRRSSRCTNRVYMGETEVEFEEIEVELETKSKKQCNSILRNSPSRLISEKSVLKKAKIETIHSTATGNPPETNSNDPSLSLETPVQMKVLNSLSSSQNCLRRSSRCTNRVYMGETEVEFEEIEVELGTKSKKRCNSILRNSPSRLLLEKSVLKKAKIEKIHSTGTENPPQTDSNDPSLSLENPVQLKVLNSLSSSQNCLRRSSRCTNRVYMGETEVGFEEIEVELEMKSKKRRILRNPIIDNSPSLLLPEKTVLKKAKLDSGKNVLIEKENLSEVVFEPIGFKADLIEVPISLIDENLWKGIKSDLDVKEDDERERDSECNLIEVPITLVRENVSELGIGYISSESSLVEVPIISGDKKYFEDIRNIFRPFEENGSEIGTEKIVFESDLTEVRIISENESPCEKIRDDFGKLKEVEIKPCLMELSFDYKKIEEIYTKNDSSGCLRKCSSIPKVYCVELKSGFESFFSSPGGSPWDNRESRACLDEEISELEISCSFVGEPVLEEEAQRRWGWRYKLKNQKVKRQCWKLNAGEEDEIILNVKCHYNQARVNNCIINLGDCALIKGDGSEDHVGKILEFFKTTDGDDYFRVQWFYRAEDTVLQKQAASHDKKRIFYSTVMNDNMLDCIVSKVSVIEVSPMLRSQPRFTSYDFYYDMEYCVEYSTFRNLPRDDPPKSSEIFAPGVSEALKTIISSTPLEKMPSREPYRAELALLDLYSGCGGMSTGLCQGAKLSSVNLITRWAVDADQAACDSLKLNHPETLVRKQNAEDFLELLKEWQKLCQRYVLYNLDKSLRSREEDVENVTESENSPHAAGEYEVQHLVDICYGDPLKTGKAGIKFKVRWLGYGPSDDTWEPLEGLSNCQERIEDFVKSGYKSKILPLPGDVDVLCGGPPCQGISGYNRHRNIISPLTDEKNRQIIVFMDIVKFLRPKYVLMENVSDILKFDKASLGRYALSRLIHMKYQARLGTMASGCYGLPQFRLRVFLWGALPSEKLPQFPLPSHDVVVRYWPALEFERNTVAYEEGKHRDLEDAVFLRDAISDLQAVTGHETREQMPYELPPETEFQKFIRLTKDEMVGFSGEKSQDTQNNILYDHRPLPLSEDETLRVSQIPHKKGANFRDLPGVIIGPDNVASWDPENKTKLPSGRPLVPKSAFHFEHGKSKRPYARVWWDETVATIVTFPNIHSMACLHPDQDRVFTIRECARLQGFPDYYRFSGSVIERNSTSFFQEVDMPKVVDFASRGRSVVFKYRQVGNAVSVPVARALGYSLGMAVRKLGGNEPLMKLPPKFVFQRTPTEEITASRK